MNVDGIISQSIKALELEIAYLENKFNSRKVSLRSGELIRASGSGFIYKFLLNEYLDESGTDYPIQLEYDLGQGPERVSGSIIEKHEDKIDLNLEIRPADYIANASLLIDKTYLYKILMERIKTDKLNKSLLSKLFNLDENRTRDVNSTSITNLSTLFEEGKVNQSQVDAIKLALHKDIAYIWGPPGTGKTRTLSYLCQLLLDENKSVMVASHTNVAVNNAAEKLGSILFGNHNDKIHSGKILRISGKYENNDKDSPKELKQLLSLDDWEELKSLELKKEITHVQGKIQQISSVIDYLEKIDRYNKEINAAEGKIANINDHISSKGLSLHEIELIISNYVSQIKTVETYIKRYEKMGGISRFLYSLSLRSSLKRKEELQTNVEKYQKQAKSLHLQAQGLKSNLTVALKTLTNLENARRQFNELSEMHSSFSDKNISQLRASIKKSKDEIEALNLQLSGLRSLLVKESSFIATTLTQTYTNKQLREKRYDVVIIDEASTAQIPQLIYACGLATENIVIVGDFRQLPSIVGNQEEPLVTEWLGSDVFEKSGITEAVRNKDNSNLVQLNKQYRMPEQIANLVNQLAYQDNPIEIANSEKNVDNGLPFSGKPLIFVNVESYASKTKSFSHFNTYSADISVNIASQYKPGDVLLISPYRQQIQYAFDRMHDFGIEGLETLTVHKVQGIEKNIVIFDLCDSLPFRSLGRPLQGGFESPAMKLLNVAISRAKKQLIIIGNLEFFKKVAGEGSSISTIIDYIVSQNLVFPGDPISFLPKVISNQKGDSQTISYRSDYTEADFDRALISDLRSNCQREFIFTLPFWAGRDFFSKYGNALKDLQDKKIEVYAIVNPKDNLNRRQKDYCLEQLNNLGVHILNMNNIHQKLYFIDRKIIFEGSQNLTHSRTREHMSREENLERVEKLLRMHNFFDLIKQYSEKNKLEEIETGKCPYDDHNLKIKKDFGVIFLKCPICSYKINPSQSILEDIYGTDYLVCDKGHPLVLKDWKGKQFLGCSKYPEHRFTRQIR